MQATLVRRLATGGANGKQRSLQLRRGRGRGGKLENLRTCGDPEAAREGRSEAGPGAGEAGGGSRRRGRLFRGAGSQRCRACAGPRGCGSWLEDGKRCLSGAPLPQAKTVRTSPRTGIVTPPLGEGGRLGAEGSARTWLGAPPLCPAPCALRGGWGGWRRRAIAEPGGACRRRREVGAGAGPRCVHRRLRSREPPKPSPECREGGAWCGVRERLEAVREEEEAKADLGLRGFFHCRGCGICKLPQPVLRNELLSWVTRDRMLRSQVEPRSRSSAKSPGRSYII